MNEPRRIQSLDRALDILEAVAEVGERGVTELAEHLGLHVATVHNLLRTLAARHYLLNVGGRYRLGPALGLLAAQWDPIGALSRLAQPHLDRLTAQLGETCVITVLVGLEAAQAHFAEGGEQVQVRPPGRRWEYPLRLATGRLLVSLGEEERWGEFIRAEIAGGPEPGERLGWSEDRWREELTRLREQGYCVVGREGHSSVNSVAAPIRGPRGVAVAALGSFTPGFRATPEHVQEMLRGAQETAAEISAVLGCDECSTWRRGR